jgi:trigger factor
LRVRIPRTDIEKFFDKELTDLVQSAVVPGFRPGKSPRRLIAHRFRKEVADQVKVSLLAKSLEQIGEEAKIEPLTTPELDFQSIELPDEGDFVYEFDVEVRPDFELPEYKGLTIRRPVPQITDAAVDKQIESLRQRFGTKYLKSGPIEAGDYIDADVRFTVDGEVIQEFADMELRVDETLLFRDAKVEGFAAAMAGAATGDARDVKVTIAESVSAAHLRGKTIDGCFVVKEVKRVDPAPDEHLFEVAEVGDLGELRDLVRTMLERRVEKAQRESVANQVTQQLLKTADWELPPDMVRKMTSRLVQRRIIEFRDAGYSEEEIRWRINQIRQNAERETIAMLHKSFLLQAIAEKEGVEVNKPDLDEEVGVMARNAGESPRRVRARIEKDDLWDVLAMNVLERKTIDAIVSQATIVDEPVAETPEVAEGVGVDLSAVPEEVTASQAEAGDAE